MRTALVIRHVAFEDLGSFTTPLLEHGYEIRYVDIGWHDLTAIDPVRPDLFIVLGGPIAAYADAKYPFLTDELRWLNQRLDNGRPILGICLGAQLLARAAGSRVYPSGVSEIGFAPITLTEAGRSSCLSAFSEDPLTLHWHGDTFDLPVGAERLASSSVCENQAFSIGRNVIGFQFHPEVDLSRIEQWLIGHAAELAAAEIDIAQIRADARRFAATLSAKAGRVAHAWLNTLP